MRIVCESSGVHFIDWTGRYSTEDIKKDHCNRNKILFNFPGWHFNVDSDEFADPKINWISVAKKAEDKGKVFCRFKMWDMVSPDGLMPDIPYNPSFGVYDKKQEDVFNVFTKHAQLTEKIVKGYPIKDAFLKNPFYGHHNAWNVDLSSSRYGPVYKLYHFKWDSSCLNRMKDRISKSNRDRFPYWANFKYFVDFYEKHGRIPKEMYEK